MTQIQENKLPEWWIETNLVNCLESLIDYRWKTPKKSDKWILTLSAKSVKMWKIDYSQAYYISPEEYKKFMVRWFPKKWDILMTTEAPLWCIAKLDRENISVAQRLLTLRWKKWVLDNDYLMYYLMSWKWQFELSSRASWSTVEWIKRSEFEKVNISLPPLPEQQAIAKILSSFDDKIELLREQNETLEKIGQEIFKEWFGRHKVWDELPEGWRVGKLGEELETFLWWTPSKLNDSFWQNWSIPWINSWEVNNFRIIEATEMITEEALKKSATKILPKWTVVIAITWATLWQYSRLEIDCCFNQSVVWMKENEKIQSSYIYFWIANNIENVIRHATWWAHQHINKENVNQTDFLIPNDENLSKFYGLANPIMEKISNNMFEIKELSKTRDELLPKLMKGEVRVV